MKILIDEKTIKKNPYYGQTNIRVCTGKKELRKGNLITVKYSYHNFNILPSLNNFIYSYLPTIIKCFNCSQEFNYLDLQADTINWDAYSNEVCPKCGIWDCLSEPLEYETIEQLEKRLGCKIETLLK